MAGMGAHQRSVPRVHFWPSADSPVVAAFDPFLPLGIDVSCAQMKHPFVIRTAIYMAAFACVPMRAAAQELPPVPSDLVDTAAVTCIRVSRSGSVVGAFILASTGDSARDAEVLEWVSQLHWPQAKTDEKLHGTWFPMPVSFGQAKPLPMPSSCSPPLHGTSV